jgi:carboxymethylenebutenolidase
MTDSTDPTAATSPHFRRRTFVGLGAAAAALGASALRAFAADELGKPHPPLVAENDPALAIDRPKIGYGDRTLDGYAARPVDAANIGGAIVVVQAIWGIDAQLRDTVRRLAKEGYAAVAPSLYTGLAAPPGDGATDIAPFRPIAAQLSDAVVSNDLAAAAAWALRYADPAQSRKSALRTAIAGFCMGGRFALNETILNPALYSAAAIWYGDLTKVNAADVKVPFLGSFGGRDTSIPADAVRKFTRELAVPYDVKIYDEAGHAFFDDTRASYVPSAATQGWDRMLAWFGTYLRPNPPPV